MTFAQVLPGLDTSTTWQRRTKGDRAARALADRHYSRQAVGAAQIGPPGRLLVLVTPCERALWVSHHPLPEVVLDRLDAWRCSVFRNEGAGLSSELIRSAMAVTAQLWASHLPADGWITWVDPDAVRSTNPGYCFLRAGWARDPSWRPARPTGLLRLRAPVTR